jgi:hypothetical protein
VFLARYLLAQAIFTLAAQASLNSVSFNLRGIPRFNAAEI